MSNGGIIMQRKYSLMSIANRNSPPRVNLAPMIDCVFLLLVFFMISTSFAPLRGLGVKLSPPGQTGVRKPKLIVRIAAPENGEEYGTMILNDEIVSMSLLLTKFQSMPEDFKHILLIQADREVLHKQIVRVIDLAKRAGVERIAFAKV